MDRVKLQCSWKQWADGTRGPCLCTPQTTVVYGCLDWHISEAVLCYRHFNLWVDICNTGMNCGICARVVDSWDSFPVDDLNEGFKTYLLVRQ